MVDDAIELPVVAVIVCDFPARVSGITTSVINKWIGLDTFCTALELVVRRSTQIAGRSLATSAATRVRARGECFHLRQVKSRG
jgi:hypothetical protein